MTLIALVAAGYLVGCAAYTPYEYHNDRDEMQGPGLFSGEDGVFTIWGKASKEDSADSQDRSDTDKSTPEDGLPDTP